MNNAEVWVANDLINIKDVTAVLPLDVPLLMTEALKILARNTGCRSLGDSQQP
jgi:phage-related holin